VRESIGDRARYRPMRTAAVVLGMLVACKGDSPPPSPPIARDARAPVPVVVADAGPDLQAIVARLWPDSCFLARDGATTIVSDAGRCAQPGRPYSTFKIANALIGLDAGVLDGPDAPMTWDKKRVPDEERYFDSWRQPHTLRSAMKVSSVPHFRTLALTIGEARMRDGLARLGYGNQNIDGGLSQFWLRGGGLRITAEQQLDFVGKLARGEVAGFSPAAQQTVREVIRLDERDGAVLFGKTGSGQAMTRDDAWLMWLVGWVERDGRILTFASWVEVVGGTFDDARAVRERRVRETLDAMGWIARAPEL
jgi:beta-lactamase class D